MAGCRPEEAKGGMMRSWNKPSRRRSDAVNLLVGIGMPVAIGVRLQYTSRERRDLGAKEGVCISPPVQR